MKLVDGNSADQSQNKLQRRYDKGLLPAEKKPYLTELKNSFGPFIATESGRLILDVSSQIATLALGFSAKPLFGTVHHLESWTNRCDTNNIRNLRIEFRKFLQRKLGWTELNLFLCNSGSESNEIALGECYRTRKNPKAKKVLAFEGSFHGRLLLALASTWNPAKRVQYEWPDFTSSFVQYPEMKGDLETDPGIPEHWIDLFASATRSDFLEKLEQLKVEDGIHKGLFETEKSVLIEIRNQLISGNIFAILMEPIQCEGGDRYSSKRFHNALANMARDFQVPLIYDEVQTGFGLGGDFFWYQLFDLQDPAGEEIYPDYVVCAKKSQVGMVLSHTKIPFDESYGVHSFIRGCLQGWMVDQLQEHIFALEDVVRVHLNAVIEEFKEHLHSPRARGLSFSFDFKDKEALGRFIACRFEHGMLYYPAGSHTARFRLNTSFNDSLLKLLFQQLTAALKQAFGIEFDRYRLSKIDSIDSFSNDFHLMFSRLKMKQLDTKEELSEEDLHKHLTQLFNAARNNEHKQLRFEVLNVRNYSQYREQISALQKVVYEPVRQTPMCEFDQAFNDHDGFGVVILDGSNLIGLSVCSPMECFANVSGIRNSSNYGKKNTLYSADITVAEGYRGAKLGSFLKYSQLLQGFSRGYNSIEGRNRDRLATGMLAHNFSVGGLPLQYLAEDYKDQEEYRDCIYYRTDLKWQNASLNLSLGVHSPWGKIAFRDHLTEDNQAFAINKMCLSNFLSEAFLENLELIAKQFPVHQQHLFTASGQSESFDKAIKTIWKYRKVQRIICVEGTYFGHGSFMARSVALPGQDFYPVDHVPHPDRVGIQKALKILKSKLAENDYLAFCVEPLMQKNMQRMDLDFLKEASSLCKQKGIPVISNDSASAFNRYSAQSFSAGPLFDADVSVLFLGAQMGLVLAHEDFFVKDPLALISTWDGDEHTLQLYTSYLRYYIDHKNEIHDRRKLFDENLREIFEDQNQLEYELHNGFGWAHGALQQNLSSLLATTVCDGRYLIIPDDDSISEYLELHGS